MAFRAMGNLKRMVTPMGRRSSQTQGRSFASSTTANAANNTKYKLNVDDVPIYIIGGFVAIAVVMAVHTGKKNLMHAPGVVIAKKKRESISEADHPDQTLASANKFTDKSFLKKVAAIQDSSKRPLPFPSHTHPDHFTRPQTVESLKSVGVDSTRR